MRVEELPRAELAHRAPGRLRLRVHERRGDERFFAALGEWLATLPDVVEVRVSARTASVLVIHDPAARGVLARIVAGRRVEVVEPPMASPMLRLRELIDAGDARLGAATRGAASLGSVGFVALVVAGIVQALDGRLLPAGLTLWKYALEAMQRQAARDG